MMGLFAIWFWLTVGGIAYHSLGPRDWSAAFDHSYWQAMALFAVWIAAKVKALTQPSSPVGSLSRPERAQP
jgi:hypothetical protein